MTAQNASTSQKQVSAENILAQQDMLRHYFSTAHSGSLKDFIDAAKVCYRKFVDESSECKKELNDIDNNKLALVYEGCKDAKGLTALHFAVYGNNLSVVSYLYDISPQLASVEDKEHGMTPVMLAAQNKFSKIVEFFVNKKSEFAKQRNFRNATVLHYATLCEDRELCKYLLSHGASACIMCPEMGTPLYVAIASGNEGIAVDMIETFNKGDVTLDHHPASHPTILHLAVDQLLETVVDKLLTHGFNPYACGSDGCTALECVIEIGSENILQLFLKHMKDYLNKAEGVFEQPEKKTPHQLKTLLSKLVKKHENESSTDKSEFDSVSNSNTNALTMNRKNNIVQDTPNAEHDSEKQKKKQVSSNELLRSIFNCILNEQYQEAHKKCTQSLINLNQIDNLISTLEKLLSLHVQKEHGQNNENYLQTEKNLKHEMHTVASTLAESIGDKENAALLLWEAILLDPENENSIKDIARFKMFFQK